MNFLGLRPKFLFLRLILIGLIGDYDNPQHLDNKLGQGKPAGYYLLVLLINIAIKSLSLWFGMGSLHFGCDLGG